MKPGPRRPVAQLPTCPVAQSPQTPNPKRWYPHSHMPAAPFRIDTVEVNPPLVLAPMEAVTNLAFRLICKRIGKPGLMLTEFVSAMALRYNARKSLKKMRVRDEERPLGIQVFGGEPETMAQSARIAEEMGADFVDINMGCWVPKVCRTGAGAALLKDPDAAEEIVKAVVKATKLPVTVKVRAGWDYALFAAPELAKRFEGAGARMLTLHARFAKQGFDGEADWSLIRELKQAVSIPVVGNGDVKTPEDALRMLNDTGCDGVMVGRAAIANPWALGRISAAMRGEPIPQEPTIEERCEVALGHLKALVGFEAGADSWEEALSLPAAEFAEAEGRGVRHLRGQVPLYVKGVPGAARARERITHCCTVAEVEDVLAEIAE
jgi:tRNA-dihydrouridine synthase B